MINTYTDLNVLKFNFQTEKLIVEDDVKLQFYHHIVAPILNKVNPQKKTEFQSEKSFFKGGRPDAVFQNIAFEYKAFDYFKSQRGVDEALYGRPNSSGGTKDRGLYDYLIANSAITDSDSPEEMEKKLTSVSGVGFDGNKFIFARFANSLKLNNVNIEKSSLSQALELHVEFTYEVSNFENGLRKLVLLFTQTEKMALNKMNLLSVVNPRSPLIRKNILNLYDLLNREIDSSHSTNRIVTLYNEWDRVFGVMFGEDENATMFNEVVPSIKQTYGLSDEFELDTKRYLFALQTYFNILLKLLVNSFLGELMNPMFTPNTALTKMDIDNLFEGRDAEQQKLVNNFFEIHFYEWFTYSEDFDTDVVNSTLQLINEFELSTYVLKPESVQDILQEVYMELIPDKLRHLMGEYFSPDWIVEFVLDSINYTGDIDKSLIDPTAGSGPFPVQALKRVIANNPNLTKEQVVKIINNIVGFDLNPISAVSAKANYIFTLFSAIFHLLEDFGEPVSIPIYIADSVLAPVVYTEENTSSLVTKTSIGEFEIPKFNTYQEAANFLDLISESIQREETYDVFWIKAHRAGVDDGVEPIVKDFFSRLYSLHRAGKDSFWPRILKNSFAPVMVGNKFDYVVGNPPWIGWKSMSKTYREGTIEVWKSYGIFEKSAYDKKTTHDDFGMAVTYVAIDQYLKVGGKMAFLLPTSFIKSTKGGEGFRKLSIIRNDQNIPFSIEAVNDFSKVRLFTVPTMEVVFTKGEEMVYPMNNYFIWNQIGKKTAFNPHSKWLEVSQKLSVEKVWAQPVNPNDLQSSWLTLGNMDFANKVLDGSIPRYYNGRKGIEPAGAKGVYILKTPIKEADGLLTIENDMSRQRRADFLKKGSHPGKIEPDYVYPMLGGRNIERWRVKSNEFMLVPHTAKAKYGLSEVELVSTAPRTHDWLSFYKPELLASRIQNGKFFNPETQPFYRLDNVGEYTFSKYKVLWKEQTGSMSAVVVETYLNSIPNADPNLLNGDKEIVVDSKVLMLALETKAEAHYVCGIINTPAIRSVIDGYAVSTNRGIDVLKYIAIPKFNQENPIHHSISSTSDQIHLLRKRDPKSNITELEEELNNWVHALFS